MKQLRLETVLVFSLFFAFACTKTHPFPTDPIIPAPGDSREMLIGSEGGTLTLDDVIVDIPAGAVAEGTEVRVVVTDETAPGSFRAFSPIVRFEPEGTVFAEPIDIQLPFEGDPDLATVFWTLREGDEYAALSTTVDGGDGMTNGVAHARSRHFSAAFVGSACQGDDCCSRATGELDVVLLVDNSNSMTEEQANLAEQLPALMEALATGDVDGDGVQDFPAVRSLQLGVVNADMGTGGWVVETCDESSFGDDGLLRTSGNTTIPGCRAEYPSIHTFSEDDDEFSSFVDGATCVAQMGVNGCGFEQPLDALLKSITPSTGATRFTMSTVGHGDGANAGLVRDDSVLALIAMTDEDDCSAADTDIFNRSSAEYAGDLNLRCYSYPEALHSIDRFADGFLATRSDPSKLVYSVIAGIPTSVSGTDFDAMLEHPDMEERIDEERPTRLVPSCNRPATGLAFPPTRIVETAQQLAESGAAATVQSICQDDFRDAVRAILEQVSSRLSGTCG